jgi:hypothetical protein
MSDSDEVSTNSTVSSITQSDTSSILSSSTLSSNFDLSSSSTISTTNSSSSDEMEIDEESDESMDISDDEQSTSTNNTSITLLTTSTEETDNDSSSDYIPSEEEEQPNKKRKRSPLDNFCIYTIKPKNEEDTNLYVGSTVNFTRRKSQHKKASTNKRSPTYWSMLYRYIRRCGGFDNFIMEKVLDFPCETKHEGLLKEKEYIHTLKATLNTANPVADYKNNQPRHLFNMS